MTSDPYSGDPLIIIGPSGATLQFSGGQPLMDQGVQNEATLRLFTDSDWVGNFVLPAQNQMGSKFESLTLGQGLTLSKLQTTSDLAVKALSLSPVFNSVSAVATNPSSDRVKLVATVGPGTAPLSLEKNGPNWQNQAVSPAGQKVTVAT